MPCYHLWPLRRPGQRTIQVPCGQCVGCRLERSRQWAVRCVQEAQLHEENCFLTLTYSDKNIPEGGTLVKKHFQDFMKRLRRFMGKERISYFHCGEYGEKSRRPHYHALIFGMDFPDKKLYKDTHAGPLYVSAALERLWGWGFCTIGALTFESAAYCARYIMKKVTGDLAKSHYERVDPETGEITQLVPEYITMSLNPAIGKEWFKTFKGDVFPSDRVVVRGREMRPPRYYDKELKRDDEEAHADIKKRREAEASKHHGNNTRKRLRVREIVKLAQISNLKRSLE